LGACKVIKEESEQDNHRLSLGSFSDLVIRANQLLLVYEITGLAS